MGEGRRVPPSRRRRMRRTGQEILHWKRQRAQGRRRRKLLGGPQAAHPRRSARHRRIHRCPAESAARTARARPPRSSDRSFTPTFLERFQAAVAASQQREERAEREEPSVGSGAGGQEAQAADDRPVTHSEQVAAPALLPKRTQGANGAPIPPPQVRSPFSLMGHAVGSGTPEPTTQPIPVITESAAPASPPSVQASRSTDPASPDAADSSQVTEGSEPAGDIPAGAGGMASARPTDTGHRR